MLTTIFCTWFILLRSAGLESSFFIGSCAAAPYFFRADGYGECCGWFDISCRYFCNFFVARHGDIYISF